MGVLGGGSIHVADNSVTSINDAIQQLMAFIDELRGLRGTVTIYSPITVQSLTTNNSVTINPDSTTTLIFQDSFIKVLNFTGSTINVGTPVYVTGASGGIPTVAPADADDSTKMPAIGLMTSSVLTGEEGEVINWGVLNGIDTSAYSDGAILYVSTTAGSLTSTVPTANLIQRIGVVATASASAGRIVVGVSGTQIQHRLLSDAHTDADTNAVVAGDIIYGNSTPEWTRLAKGTDGQALVLSGGLPAWADVTAGEATDVSNVEAGGSEQEFEKLIAGTNITLTELANGSALQIDAAGGSSTVGMYSPDAAPSSTGTDDDEFADNSGGVPGGWTEYDHGSIVTVSENLPGVVITETTGSSAWGGIYKAVQSGDWTIWTKVSISRLIQTQFRQAALAIFEDATSSTGDLEVFQIFTNNTGITSLRLDLYSAYNTYSSTTVSAYSIQGTNVAGGIYLRARRTGTTYAFDWSSNGIGWQRIYSGALAFTAAHYGLVFMNTTADDARATFQFFRFVASDVGLNGEVYGNRF